MTSKRPGSDRMPSSLARKPGRNQKEDLRTKLGAELKTYYTLARRRYSLDHGGNGNYVPLAKYDGIEFDPDNPERKGRPSEWEKKAAEMYALRYDAEEYVRAVFEAVANTDHGPILLPHLLSDGVQAMYQQHQETSVATYTYAFAIEKRALADRLDWEDPKHRRPKATLASVLLDDMLPVSALFRYCTAFNMRDEKFFGCVLRKYEDRAVRHYICGRETFDKVWGLWIPQEFKDLAEKKYDNLLRGGNDNGEDEEE